ncbi:DUF4153 domain-containing protein [Senegalia massiliensis]|uniref:DUF4153 domain-containing protein n=1 Tax=Senegalia massiliensis TaxID=1720316 RepID=UPI0010317476|nr:DUF4153 domain-containing protein [Senegalia massiliensis]
MNIIEGFKKLPNRISESLKRFPISLLYSVLTVCLLIYINHNEFLFRDDGDLYSRIAMILALGIPLSLSIYVFFETKDNVKKSIEILGHIFTPIILIGYYFLLLNEIDYVSGTRYTAYMIAFFIIFSFIPYIKRKHNYELYVIRLFSRFIVTYVYSVVLYLGLAAILTTINLLFNADIPGKIFADIAFVVAGIFAPAFFLADIPKKGDKITIRSFPKVLKVLLEYIVLPLISIYTIILYVYFGKIIITSQLPQNIIGNLVLWYSIIMTIVLFFIYPLKGQSKWINNFIKIFPKAIIPLIGMMFWAVALRINAYGITEDRYFVIAVGIWVTGVMIYYSLKKDIRNIWVTISLALIIIISVTGPISAYSVSKWSQNNRFEKLLKSNNMLTDSLDINPNENVSEDVQREVSSIIRYFLNYHSLDDIRFLSDGFDLREMEDVFGFDLKEDHMYPYQNRNYFNHILEDERIISIEDYDYFTFYTTYEPQSAKIFGGDYSVKYSSSNDEIVIKNNDNEIYTKNINDIARKIHKDSSNKDILDMNDMKFTDQNNDIKVQILFKNINGNNTNSNENIEIERVEFFVFIKIK